MIRSQQLFLYCWHVLAGVGDFRVRWYPHTWPSKRRGAMKPEERTTVMFKSMSTSLILLGVLAIIAGILALAWPGVTVLALVILFAVYVSSMPGCRRCGRSAARRPDRSSGTCCSGWWTWRPG